MIDAFENRSRFLKWLQETISNQEYKTIVDNIETVDSILLRERYLVRTLFLYEDALKIRQIRHLIEKNPSFHWMHRKHFDHTVDTLRHYQYFCEHCVSQRKPVDTVPVEAVKQPLPEIKKASEPSLVTPAKTKPKVRTIPHDAITKAIAKDGFTFFDNREENDCIWIPASQSMQKCIDRYKRLGFSANFVYEGCALTHHRSAWKLIELPRHSPQAKHASTSSIIAKPASVPSTLGMQIESNRVPISPDLVTLNRTSATTDTKSNARHQTQVFHHDASCQDAITRAITADGLEYFDDRAENNCIWIKAAPSNTSLFSKYLPLGYVPSYSTEGCEYTRFRSAWKLVPQSTAPAPMTQQQDAAQAKPIPIPRSKVNTLPRDEVTRAIAKDGFSFFDDREDNRCIWIPASRSIMKCINRYRCFGFDATYVTSGCDLTRHRPSWKLTERLYVVNTVPITNSIAQETEALKATPALEEFNQLVTTDTQPLSEQNECISPQSNTEHATSQSDDTGTTVAETPENNLYSHFVAWMKEREYAPATIRSYGSAINEISCFAFENLYTTRDLYLENDPDIVTEVLNGLWENDEFRVDNQTQHNRLRAALRKYIDFLFDYLPTAPTVNILESPISTPTTASPQWKKVLEDGFPDGYIMDDFISQLQAVDRWQEIWGEPCPLSGEAIDEAIAACGTVKDGRVFVSTEQENQLIAQISDTICTVLETYSGLYADQLYERYRDQLTGHQVFSTDVLLAQLQDQTEQHYVLKGDIITKPQNYISVVSDCYKVFRNHGCAMTVHEIADELWFIPYDKIYQSLAQCDDCINIGQSTWMLVEHFPFSQEDANRVREAIQRELLVREYLVNTDILPILRKQLPDIAENLTPWDTSAVFNLLRYYLGKAFSFTRAIVAPVGKDIDIKSLFRNFAASHPSFTLDELETFANDEIGIQVYWGSIYEAAVRVNANEFVSHSNMHFDVEETDRVLEQICPEDYISLQAISPPMLMHLPSCGYPWNGYLLLCYLFSFSRIFRLCYNSLSKKGYHGAMVRRTAQDINCYSKLVERVLSDSDNWATSTEALALLVKEGYQARKTFTGIDHIVEQAKLNKNNE